MEFKIKEKFEQGYTDISFFDIPMTDVMGQALTDEQYHELCHQLFGSKAEFDEVDGECTIELNLADETEEEKRIYRRHYTVLSALSRGIFWKTLKALRDIDAKKEEEIEED